jgi:hypothetical protein
MTRNINDTLTEDFNQQSCRNFIDELYVPIKLGILITLYSNTCVTQCVIQRLQNSLVY